MRKLRKGQHRVPLLIAVLLQVMKASGAQAVLRRLCKHAAMRDLALIYPLGEIPQALSLLAPPFLSD